MKTKRASFIFCAWLLAAAPAGAAKEYRWGIAVGFGGTGASETTEVDGSSQVVKRSEGPGVFMLSADRQFSARWGLTAEHARGFRLGPFSTGVSFTGVTSRWYPMAAAPFLSDPGDAPTSLVVRQYAPFVGFSGGLASGQIAREGDKVPLVSASGMYVGTRFGADHLLRQDLALRYEMSFSTTIFASATKPSSMTEFSLRVGWIFPF